MAPIARTRSASTGSPGNPLQLRQHLRQDVSALPASLRHPAEVVHADVADPDLLRRRPDGRGNCPRQPDGRSRTPRRPRPWSSG